MGVIIDLTSLFPWRFLMLLAYSFAYFNIAHALLKDKFHSVVTFLSIFAARLGLSIVSNYLFDEKENGIYSVIFLFLFLFITTILLVFLTEGKTTKKILVTVFYLISHMFTGLISSIYCEVLFRGEDLYAVYNVAFPKQDFLQVFIANVILELSISFLFSGILKLFNARKSEYAHKKLWAYFFFLPITQIWFFLIILFFIPVDANINFSKISQIFLMTILALILVFDCSFPFVVDYFEKVEIQNEQQRKEFLMADLNYQQTQILKEEQQQFRKIKHDFLNLTTTAQGFIEIGKPEKALSILSETNEDLTMSSGYFVCSNDTINTILYIKQKKAQEAKVQLSVDVEETSFLLIDDYYVCRVIHNIIDNAIEAATESAEKVVDVKIIVDDDNFKMDCSNSFVENQTPKAPREGHGYGLKIVKDISKSYNGNYKSRKENNMFYSSVVMKNSNNE